MTRTQREYWPLFIIVTAGLFFLLTLLQRHGYQPVSETTLWGRSLLTTGGQVPFRAVVTAYPPAPMMTMVGMDYLAPWLGALTPLALSALLAGGLVTAWFASFRANGLGLATSLTATSLLTFNPFALRAAAEGVNFLLPLWGFWLLASGMIALKRQSHINDVMLIALALTVLGVSGFFGLALVLASLPFLALVAPNAQMTKSTSGIYLILLFPLGFSAAGFLFLNWIFTGNPLHFLSAFRVTGTPLPTQTVGSLEMALLATLLSCPLGIATLALSKRSQSFPRGILAIAGLLLASLPLAWFIHKLPEPMLMGALGCTLSAAILASSVETLNVRTRVLPLLAIGLLGGSVFAFADRTKTTATWRQALLAESVKTSESTLARLGRALRGKTDVLFDGEAAPMAIAARGSADGILGPHSEAFELASLTHLPKASYLVVRNDSSLQGSDQLGLAFPQLFDAGLPGYRLIFNSPTWRIFQSNRKSKS